MSDLIKQLTLLKEGISNENYYDELNHLLVQVDEIIKSVSELEDLVVELGERDV